MQVRVTPGYTDAAGKLHLSIVLERDGKPDVRGEAIWDTRLARTVLQPEELEMLPREAVVAIKKAVTAAARKDG